MQLMVHLVYRLREANVDSPKNRFLLKNPQFLPNLCETLSKYDTRKYIIWAKFCNDWAKIVDFLKHIFG